MNLTMRRWMAALALAVLLPGASAFAQGGGIKGGFVFPDFTTDVFNTDNRTGWQVGLFVGGNRDGVIGVQTEFNWLRNETEFTGGLPAENGTVTLDYLQIPVLLRLNAGAQSFAFYGIAGPSFEVKVHDEISGFGGATASDSDFEGFNISLMFGGGIEISRFIIEGRYARGLKTVNQDFLSTTELKVNSFAALVGFRFK